jgi:hypothetical protein
MKKFLDELNKARDTQEVITYPGSQKISTGMRSKFEGLKGRRALHVVGKKEAKVVTIGDAYDNFVSVTFNYYGRERDTVGKSSVSYSSLLCGDEKLEVEE